MDTEMLMEQTSFDSLTDEHIKTDESKRDVHEEAKVVILMNESVIIESTVRDDNISVKEQEEKVEEDTTESTNENRNTFKTSSSPMLVKAVDQKLVRQSGSVEETNNIGQGYENVADTYKVGTIEDVEASSETNAAVESKNLQDPEVSSGISQYTQTLADNTQVFVDASTSPHQKIDWSKPITSTTGVQCDMIEVTGSSKTPPSLRSLASNSLQFVYRMILTKSENMAKLAECEDEE